MKKNLVKLIAVASTLCMALPVFASCKKDDSLKAEDAKSYVSVDINPSLSFTLDKHDKVISVHAENEDAMVMLYGEDLKGLKIDAALKKVADLSVELGYVNDGNYGVSVNVSGKVKENQIVGKLQGAFDKTSGEIKVNVDTEGTFKDLVNLESIKANYENVINTKDLSMSHLKLILDAQSVDGTLDFETALNLSEEELIKIVAKGVETIEPYATKAYNTALTVAERVYNEAKGALIDSLWLAPYNRDIANHLLGKGKYTVNNGAIYNMYTNSSRALSVVVESMEKVKELAENTEVPQAVIDSIAETLKLTADEKADFVNQITVDGKVTVANLEKYLNRWFKNMTKEEREQAKAEINALVANVNTFITTIDNEIAEEYKVALKKLCEDLNSLIPEKIDATAKAYYDEFKTLVTDLAKSVDGKEPLVALRSAKKVFDDKVQVVMERMRKELTKEDLDAVEASIKAVNANLAVYEKAFSDAKKQAETEAKNLLESLKNKRK